jgi:predicted phosphodiesterase
MVCPHCSSLYVVKEGKRKNSEGALYQRMSCKSCKKWYSLPIDTEVRGRLPEISSGKILSVKYNEKVRIHGLTDVHVGASEFDMKKFKECIVTIMEDPNARWFGNGDLIELIPPGYKSISQRGQSISPEEQYLTFLDLVQPIRDKCLFLRGGNHDFLRSQIILDLDIVKLIANELNVPYYPMPGYTRIDVQGTRWNLVSGHGKSGGKNGDLELDKMAAVYSQGDVFFLGHNHQLYVKPIDSLKIVNDEETLYRRWYIRGGSFLRYAEYARYSFYPIVRAGWTTIEFSKDRIKCWTN